jgi:hypothetical protein
LEGLVDSIASPCRDDATRPLDHRNDRHDVCVASRERALRRPVPDRDPIAVWLQLTIALREAAISSDQPTDTLIHRGVNDAASY